MAKYIDRDYLKEQFRIYDTEVAEQKYSSGGGINYGTDIPTNGNDGDVYFQVTDTKIINIWQKVNGTWLSLQQAVSIGNIQRVNSTVSVSIANHV